MTKYKILKEEEIYLDYATSSIGFERVGSSFMVYHIKHPRSTFLVEDVSDSVICERTAFLNVKTLIKIHKLINKKATRCKVCGGSGTVTTVTHPGRIGGYDMSPCSYCNGAGEKAKQIVTDDFEFSVTKKKAAVTFKEKSYSERLQAETITHRPIGTLSEVDLAALLDIIKKLVSQIIN